MRLWLRNKSLFTYGLLTLSFDIVMGKKGGSKDEWLKIDLSHLLYLRPSELDLEKSECVERKKKS